VDTSAFLNPIEGTFSVVQNGNALDLVYTIPEPSSGAVLFFGIGSLLLSIGRGARCLRSFSVGQTCREAGIKR